MGLGHKLTVEEYLDWIEKYIKETKANPKLVQEFVGKDGKSVQREKEMPISLKGFKNYMYKHGYKNMYNYIYNNKNIHDEYIEASQHLKDLCEQDHADGAMVGIYNGQITGRLNGWADKTETSANVTVTQITGMEIK